MSEICVRVNINLKTGFFKSEAYVLQVCGDFFKLMPACSEEVKGIVIEYKNIKTITVSSGEPVEIEIRAGEDIWVGTFPKITDISEIIKFFSMVLGEKFIYI